MKIALLLLTALTVLVVVYAEEDLKEPCPDTCSQKYKPVCKLRRAIRQLYKFTNDCYFRKCKCKVHFDVVSVPARLCKTTPLDFCPVRLQEIEQSSGKEE